MSACCTIIVLFVVGGAPLGQAPTTTAPTDLEGLNPRWLKPTEQNIDQQVETLTAAYELDEAMVQRLRDELHRRLLEQVPVEQQYQQSKVDWAKRIRGRPGGPSTVSPEERRQFLEGMKRRVEALPLNEKLVAAWLESQLPAEQTQAGRRRLEELWHRREAQRNAFMADGQEQADAKQQSIMQKDSETAPLSPAAEPMPTGPKGAEIAAAQPPADAGKTVRPDQGLTQVPQKPAAPPKIDPAQPRTEPLGGAVKKDKTARTPTEPAAGQRVTTAVPGEKGGKQGGPDATVGKEGAVQGAPLAPAPPLDEWDKYVISVTQKYGFSDAQITKARGILGDLRNRAYQYRLSHANDYASAELIADAKARADRLKQLNAAMDALFAELKARLESLPTLEQKQKAASPPKKGPDAAAPRKGSETPPPAKDKGPTRGK